MTYVTYMMSYDIGKITTRHVKIW